MRVSHAITAVFDDPNLVSCAGLASVLQLAERAGLQDLVAKHVRIDKPGGGNAHLKVPALVAGMIAGADSIEDMALLRHGAMAKLFTGVRAPSTLGTFRRTFTFGHVRQLDAVASRLLINLSKTTPLLPGADSPARDGTSGPVPTTKTARPSIVSQALSAPPRVVAGTRELLKQFRAERRCVGSEHGLPVHLPGGDHDDVGLDVGCGGGTSSTDAHCGEVCSTLMRLLAQTPRRAPTAPTRSRPAGRAAARRAPRPREPPPAHR